jgi:transcription antitermination factor NusG
MHSFNQYVNDAEKLLETETLKGFTKELVKQSNTTEAVNKYQVLSPKEDEYTKFKSPLYFGSGVEFLSFGFFDFFGSDYNLIQVTSIDDWDNPQRDIGFDLNAVSQKHKKYKKQAVVSEAGSPIYIQVKGTDNPIKEHMTNDGSRIMNFVGASLAKARKDGNIYTTRLILFTLGKGLHWALNDNTSNCVEVIGNIQISKKIDNNPYFWNHMRKLFNLPIKSISSPMDPEGKAIIMELQND